MKYSGSFLSRNLGVLICLLVFLNLNGGKNHWQGIPEADARGYYAWLPAIFIYQDLHFSFMDSLEGKKYFNENLYYEYRIGYEGKVINKYFAGTAFAQMPFFGLAHLWAIVGGYDADGYSKPYMMMIGIAALFWLIIGLFWTDRLLDLYAISDTTRALTLGAFLFGSNLFYYAVVEPGMSHIYSFALFAGVFYFSKKYQAQKKGQDWMIAMALMGLAVAVRPVNLIAALAFPFVLGGWKNSISTLRNLGKKPLFLLSSLLIFGIFPIAQMFLHFLQTGVWGVRSYPNETFDFLHPQIFAILFSYKKGLFLYTPIYLLSIVMGLFFLYRPGKVKALSWFFLFWFVQVWVFSSWWCWWYGGSFSGRPFLDFGVLLIVLLAAGIEYFRTFAWGKWLSFLILSVLVAFCQFQIYQYRYYLIHWEDMNREKYWEVFMQIP
jgi:MFS family permease